MTAVLAIQPPSRWLLETGITNENVYYQLPPQELVSHALKKKQGVLNNTGALVICTGQFTGRSPADKFIVKDGITARTVDWNKFNQPIEERFFLALKEKMSEYLNKRAGIYVRDCSACADERYRINIRCINENPQDNLFVHNMFLRPEEERLAAFKPDWLLISAPGFQADSVTDGTRQTNFSVISFKHRTILIGGTGYTGEIKKGVFTVLNFLLPQNENVLGMHCSANMDKDGNTALFFGLSGTGKTTLSADADRQLIGDDEHGWSEEGIFNFEGGCYAKAINLDEEKEPLIFQAVKSGALVENTTFFEGSNEIDFASKSITENTRVSYPLDYIGNAVIPSSGKPPHIIFFLACDAYGVLPPISRLTTEQAMYYFVNGYTARVAGTETGVDEPKAVFSACFGSPFLPLHATRYAGLLGKRISASNAAVWLVNTGWIGGSYGTGERIRLPYTRAMINAVLTGGFEKSRFDIEPIFSLAVPKSCPDVPSYMLDQRNLWPDKSAFEKTAKMLSKEFSDNYARYAGFVETTKS